jgi:hypothetical protein
MPRNVALKQTLPGAMMTTWKDNETYLFWRLCGTQVAYRVVLHEEECTGLMPEVLHGGKGRPLAMYCAHFEALTCSS